MVVVRRASARKRVRRWGTEFGLRLAATLFYETYSLRCARRPARSSRRRCRGAAAAARADPAAARPKDASRSSRRPTSASTSRDRRSSCPQHPVPRAKFPVIDIHGHPPTPDRRPSASTRVGESMAPLNLQVMVNANGTSERSAEASGVDAIRASRYKDRMVMFTELDFRETSAPAPAQKTAAQLEADVKAGALGVGEIMKSFGLTIKKADGTRLKLDDPELDPVWEKARGPEHPGVHPRRRSVRVLPAARLQQRALARAGALSGSPVPGSARFPAFEELMASAIGCSRSIREHDVDPGAPRLARERPRARSASMFDRMPNVYSRSRRRALRHRPAAAHGARLLRQVPGPDPVRQGQLSARRVSVLLARVRNQRRVLRLLPRLPRVLEAVRHRPARSRC